MIDIEKWLFRVAINNCKNHFKSAWIKKRIFNYRFEESKDYRNQDDLIIYLSKSFLVFGFEAASDGFATLRPEFVAILTSPVDIFPTAFA